ncbi:hypothetical protein [Pedobacter mucosus]|uniref:hypothetical protein n=1 Tax=Pedobacter mucosus TaxID=2895286 RepID=UPI001EE4872E|nr:hypothetical protein [Pedobacter mucosus]UKT62145.1 hypothetical protein LOK61_10255 [Pedobacter mucosus]
MLTERIYYVTNEIKRQLSLDFELVEEKGWYLLYKRNFDKSYWRLDKPEKYQTQYFLKLNTLDNWAKFDAKDLQVNLLKKERGRNEIGICIWENCLTNSLNGLIYCEKHAYEEMGIRA